MRRCRKQLFNSGADLNPLEHPPFIGGSNLTATKARLLLMAALMKFGSLPPAADPDRPTAAESEAIRRKILAYQLVFDTH